MNLLSIRTILLLSIAIILNFTLLPDGQAFQDRYFSLTTYCIGGEEFCDDPFNPFDESPYIYEINVAFYCDTGTLCLSGSFDIGGGFGGGIFRVIPPLFRASFNGKTQSLDLFGLWIPGVMMGLGNHDDYLAGHNYNFFFVGKRTSDFD